MMGIGHDDVESEECTLVLVRCVEYSTSVKRTLAMVRGIFPRARVVAVPDRLNETHDFPSGLEILPLTAEKLDELNLFHKRGEIGWSCGDYALYLALSLRWTNAWVLEPDVLVSEAAYPLLTYYDATQTDLITTDFRVAENEWSWRSRLEDAADVSEVAACFFPLTRVSRRLATKCLNFRQELTDRLNQNPDLWVPNDESVVATVSSSGFTVVDLKSRHPSYFERWSWGGQPYGLSTLASPTVPFIAHPVTWEATVDGQHSS